MIALLRGEVAERGPGVVTVDVSGVGYRVLVPAGLAVPLPGKAIVLHTSLQVREDSMTLYGFLEREELRLFELLLTSSGVGPKLALAALSALPPSVLEAAISEGDVAVLTSVSGIGRKVADRIVLELKDRVGSAVGVPSGSAAAQPDGTVHAVREALAGFGFTPVEVREALAQLEADPEEDSGALLRRALRVLGPAAGGGA